MAEYIEREAVLKYARPIEVGAFSEIDVVTVENIKNVPAADVAEVVRCKECTYSADVSSGVLYCCYFNKNVEENDYCSNGC